MTSDRPARPQGRAVAAGRSVSSRTRVVIADHQELSRAGLRWMLEHENDFEVVGEAADGAELIHLVDRLRPDLVLTDAGLPEIDGIAATRRLLERRPGTTVVMVTASEDPEVLLAALRAGANGYALKNAARADLIAVMRRALSGGASIEPGLASNLLLRLATTSSDRTTSVPEPLTPREREILNLVAEGRTNREIAGRLIMAVGTVKIHVEHILAKLGVKDRTQAAVRGVELGLLRRDDDEPDPTSVGAG